MFKCSVINIFELLTIEEIPNCRPTRNAISILLLSSHAI